jgi:hypothetical protein
MNPNTSANETSNPTTPPPTPSELDWGEFCKKTTIQQLVDNKTTLKMMSCSMHIALTMYLGMIHNILTVLVNGVFTTDLFKQWLKSIITRALVVQHWTQQLTSFSDKWDPETFKMGNPFSQKVQEEYIAILNECITEYMEQNSSNKSDVSDVSGASINTTCSTSNASTDTSDE